MAGPTATMLLGDLGADVVKVEPLDGETTRVVDLVHPVAGPIKALGVPVKLSDTPGAVPRPAPLVGEHTAEILRELGYSAAAQQALAERGVV